MRLLAAAAFGGPGPAYRAAAAFATLGGALLVAEANLVVLRASGQSRRVSVDGRFGRIHWGLGLAVAVALAALPLAVPLPIGPLAPHGLAMALRHLHAPAPPPPSIPRVAGI